MAFVALLAAWINLEAEMAGLETVWSLSFAAGKDKKEEEGTHELNTIEQNLKQQKKLNEEHLIQNMAKYQLLHNQDLHHNLM